MKIINLHGTSLAVSSICLGTANFGSGVDEAQAFAILDAFMEAGGTFLDTANCYGKWNADKINISERIIGRWLKSRRCGNRMVVATKGAHPEMGGDKKGAPRMDRKSISDDLDESMAALGIDKIPLYWLHRDDPRQPIGDILELMETFVASGRVCHYAASNFTLDRMKEARAFAAKKGIRGFVAVQNKWSLAEPAPDAPKYGDPTMVASDDAFVSWHAETKTPAIPYNATASGFFEKLDRLNPVLEGNTLSQDEFARLSKHVWDKMLTPRNLKIYAELRRMKSELNASMQTLSLAWFSSHPFDAIPITGVRNTAQLADALAAGNFHFEKLF